MTLRISISKSLLLAALLLPSLQTTRAGNLMEAMDSEVSALYAKTKDAIVKVHSERQVKIGNLPVGSPYRVGTGFFIDPQGHLLTASTVIDGADQIWVDWQGQKIAAQVTGHDACNNLAVLKVDPSDFLAEGQQLPAVTLGNSDELKVGSMVIAIGFPYDLPSAPSVGFVTGDDIRCGNHTFMTSHLRASCHLRPGQGGGPLFNTHGEVVGMAVAAHLDDQCYALPANAMRKLADDIIKYGAPQHAWVGLNVSERRVGLCTSAGPQFQVYVQQVYSNTPAAHAGFKDSDVVIRIDTNEIRRSADVLNVMFRHRCGEKLKLTIVRNDATQDVQIVVGQRPEEASSMVRANPQILPAGNQMPMPTIIPASHDTP